jgi:hypothetical protein
MRRHPSTCPGRLRARARTAMLPAAAVTAAAAMVTLPVALAPAAAASPSGTKVADTVTVTSHFVWVPSGGSISGDSTFINNGATNGHRKDLLFVTPNLTPGGIDPCPCLLFAAPPVGVWYNGSRWGIFNEDSSSMGTLMSYNVLVVPRSGNGAFIVKSKVANTTGNYVVINSAATNGKPKALIQVTQNYNPGSVSNDHPVGVRYLPGQHKWAIFNEDHAAMPLGAGFNVLVGTAATNGGKSGTVTTTSHNRPRMVVFFSNPRTTGNPNNITFVTQDYNPGGKGHTGNPGVLPYVAYSGSKEFIANWSGPSPPLRASFNLLIFSS